MSCLSCNVQWPYYSVKVTASLYDFQHNANVTTIDFPQLANVVQLLFVLKRK